MFPGLEGVFENIMLLHWDWNAITMWVEKVVVQFIMDEVAEKENCVEDGIRIRKKDLRLITV